MNDTVIITGATGSIGSEAVRHMADEGFNVIMACRNMEKAHRTAEALKQQFHNIKVMPLHLDLSSLESVRTFCSEVTHLAGSSNLKLCGLFNNAGTICRTYGKTPEGFEQTLATNYLGPYLLTRLLLPHMSEGSHIVNMVSLTCRFGNVDRTLFDRNRNRFSQLGTYADSKLALLLFSIALGRQLQAGNARTFVNVADPGVVNSNMISMGRWFDPLADRLFRPLCKSPEKGVLPALNALHTENTLRYFKGKDKQFPIPERYTENNCLEWLWDHTGTVVGI